MSVNYLSTSFKRDSIEQVTIIVMIYCYNLLLYPGDEIATLAIPTFTS